MTRVRKFQQLDVLKKFETRQKPLTKQHTTGILCVCVWEPNGIKHTQRTPKPSHTRPDQTDASEHPLIDSWGLYSAVFRRLCVSLTTEIDWMWTVVDRWGAFWSRRKRRGAADQNIENNCQLLVAFVTWLTGQDVCFLYQLDHKISKTNCLASIWPQKQKLMVKSYKWSAGKQCSI